MNIKPVNKQALYQIASGYSKEVIVRLHELTQSKNENVALGACKALLDKALPDIRYDLLEMRDSGKPTLILDIAPVGEMLEKVYGSGTSLHTNNRQITGLRYN
jgi:hypothetical protein